MSSNDRDHGHGHRGPDPMTARMSQFAAEQRGAQGEIATLLPLAYRLSLAGSAKDGTPDLVIVGAHPTLVTGKVAIRLTLLQQLSLAGQINANLIQFFNEMRKAGPAKPGDDDGGSLVEV